MRRARSLMRRLVGRDRSTYKASDDGLTNPLRLSCDRGVRSWWAFDDLYRYAELVIKRVVEDDTVFSADL